MQNIACVSSRLKQQMMVLLFIITTFIAIYQSMRWLPIKDGKVYQKYGNKVTVSLFFL